MTLALSVEVSFPRRPRASSKPTRRIRSISFSVYFRVSTARRPREVSHRLLRLAEVQAARQLPHDHDVDALQQVRLDRAGVDDRGEDLYRPEVREQVEALTDGEDAVLWPGLGVWVVPLGTAYRSEEHAVDAIADLQRLVRERGAKVVDGIAADPPVAQVEVVPEPGSDGIEDLDGLGSDLGAYSVSRQYRNR